MAQKKDNREPDQESTGVLYLQMGFKRKVCFLLAALFAPGIVSGAPSPRSSPAGPPRLCLPRALRSSWGVTRAPALFRSKLYIVASAARAPGHADTQGHADADTRVMLILTPGVMLILMLVDRLMLIPGTILMREASCVEGAMLSRVEGAVLSRVEGDMLSRVEGNMLSRVEGKKGDAEGWFISRVKGARPENIGN